MKIKSKITQVQDNVVTSYSYSCSYSSSSS